MHLFLLMLLMFPCFTHVFFLYCDFQALMILVVSFFLYDCTSAPLSKRVLPQCVSWGFKLINDMRNSRDNSNWINGACWKGKDIASLYGAIELLASTQTFLTWAVRSGSGGLGRYKYPIPILWECKSFCWNTDAPSSSFIGLLQTCMSRQSQRTVTGLFFLLCWVVGTEVSWSELLGWSGSKKSLMVSS